MQNLLQKAIVGALVVAALMLGMQPAAADPAGPNLIEQDRSLLRVRIKPSLYNRTLDRERGKNGQLSRDRNANRLRRDKGFNGEISNARYRNASRTPFLSRARSSLLRNSSFFNGRPLVSNLQRGRNNLRNGRVAVSNRLRGSGSRVLHPASAFRSKPGTQTAQRPTLVGDISSARACLSSYFSQNTIGALLIQADPKTGKTYRLQFAQAPITRQVNNNKVAVRCSFYGSTSASSPSVPVVVEFTLNGTGQRWNVGRVQFVSVNGERLAGEFDIDEADLVESASALDEKAFPHKTL